jgi:hypothetical protein
MFSALSTQSSSLDEVCSLNFNIRAGRAETGLMAGLLLLLQCCVSAPQTASLQRQSISIPASHEISQVPFFPQQEFYCGPTTLAEILNYYAIEVAPEQVSSKLFIPDRRGSLQVEMISSVRQYGMLAYAESGNLLQLLSLVSEDIPVIVLQNLGVSWMPVWHYALVIGYDLEQQWLRLHTGVTEGRLVPMDLFERTWERGDYWLLAAVPPDKSSKFFDAFKYISAAQDLMAVGMEAAAVKALESASTQWSSYWLPYFLLGNHYLEENPVHALNWFRQGLDVGATNPSYLNNYAYALLYNNCDAQALDVIQQAIMLQPDNPTLQDSLQDIRYSRASARLNTATQHQSCAI